MNDEYGERTSEEKELALARHELRVMLDSEYEIGGSGELSEIFGAINEDPSFRGLVDVLYNQAERKLSKMHPEKREDILNDLTSNGDAVYSPISLVERVIDAGDLYRVAQSRRVA